MRMLVPGNRKQSVGALAYSPDGSRLAVVGQIGDGPCMCVWHPQHDRPLVRTPINTGPGRCIAFAPEGEEIAVGNGRDRVFVCDARTGETLHMLGGIYPTAVTIAFSPNGEQLLVGGADRGAMNPHGSMTVYHRPNYETGRLLDLGGAYALAYPRDGGFFALATGHGDIDLLFDPWPPANEQYRVNKLIRHMAISPDGRYVAAAVGHRVWLGDRETGQSRLHGKSSKPMNGLAFSSDGRRLGVAGGDGVVRFWQVGTWEELTAYEWGFRVARCVAFSPDGLTCAAGGEGKVALVIWDVEG